MTVQPANIVVLKPLTAKVVANNRAKSLVLDLTRGNRYCVQKKWGRAVVTLRDARRLLNHVDQDLVECAETLRGITVGFQKLENRLRFRC